MYEIFDFSNGYWKKTLDKQSQSLQSFITPYEIYSPTRLLQVKTSSLAHFQTTISGIITTLLRNNELFSEH